ncbi:uncharacterized protein LOC112269736 [Brachypodium distachyon]|uniref:DUF3511 domain-containing protein n=1 Tax=Brachypodium distachyon TaxID=15368 RepID=I1GQX4_BRADI|nr:uncharacterized protein LOC112269736 [Brachypodium distachyon]KQK14521.1 hypothetical protein BRADI_1g16830v3 [Brachypodium distachyon]|eukprot:XP_024312486.1 uncharacterized protein LOC112269736 [Brachypodium distachyon]
MAPTYRPYAAAAAEYGGRGGGGDAVVVTYGGGGERKAARWVGLGSLGLGSSSSWLAGPDQAEMKRRGRVASYKAYAVEGKVKASIRRGIRWIKTKCSHIVHR